jgi:hypothetical protein
LAVEDVYGNGGKMNAFKQWLRGLVSVAISSAASGVALVVADPQSFNLQKGLPKLAEVCAVLSLVHVALYLQKAPIWDEEPKNAVIAGGDVTINNPKS